MKNIRSFLTSCVRDFGLSNEALFDASELFDVSDFAKVRVKGKRISLHGQSESKVHPQQIFLFTLALARNLFLIDRSRRHTFCIAVTNFEQARAERVVRSVYFNLEELLALI